MVEPQGSNVTPKATKSQEAPKRVVRVVQSNQAGKKQSIWSDPVTRVLGIVLAVIVVGALMTVVNGLLNGTVDLTGTPSSASERLLANAEAQVGDGSDPDTWQKYILALIYSGKTDEAQEQLKKMEKAELDDSKGQNVLFIKAALAQAEGNKDEAIKLYKETVAKSYEVYNKELNSGNVELNWAIANGPHENYSESLLALMSLYSQDKDWTKALAYADEFLKLNPREGDIFIARGKIQVELGDLKSARKDFKSALKYLPGDEEATAELKNIEGK